MGFMIWALPAARALRCKSSPCLYALRPAQGCGFSAAIPNAAPRNIPKYILCVITIFSELNSGYDDEQRIMDWLISAFRQRSFPQSPPRYTRRFMMLIMITKKIAAKKCSQMITALAPGKVPVIVFAFMRLVRTKVK